MRARLRDGEVELRPPTEDDAAAVADAVQRSMAELTPWMPWATPDYDVDSALEWIRGELGPGVGMVICEDGEIVGSCGLSDLDELNNRAGLGYWVRSDRTGRGVARRAALLLGLHGLGDLGYARLEIIVAVTNVASRRVAEAAGGVHEGVLRHRLRLHGEMVDAHMYALVAGEWP